MSSEPFKILVVDDDPDDVELARQMLGEARFPVEIRSARNGREALAVLLQMPPYEGAPRPDLILLDLNMPVMDGREFLRVVKADRRFEAIPVVVLTTSKVAEEIVACYGLGANGFVSKPMKLDQFAELEQVVSEFRDDALRRARAG